jgi:hypothetical protein
MSNEEVVMGENVILEVSLKGTNHQIKINTGLVKAPEHISMILSDCLEHFLKAFNADANAAELILRTFMEQLSEKGIIYMEQTKPEDGDANKQTLN